jgi:hypothetical protein
MSLFAISNVDPSNAVALVVKWHPSSSAPSPPLNGGLERDDALSPTTVRGPILVLSSSYLSLAAAAARDDAGYG